ncbi:hypothetical protein BJ170DRAFT_467453 [Xylariales sp. AK1849]|nr:hypothetical protein BJ170DRAFT_467453 [Xylariales sp. AK1849]
MSGIIWLRGKVSSLSLGIYIHGWPASSSVPPFHGRFSSIDMQPVGSPSEFIYRNSYSSVSGTIERSASINTMDEARTECGNEDQGEGDTTARGYTHSDNQQETHSGSGTAISVAPVFMIPKLETSHSPPFFPGMNLPLQQVVYPGHLVQPPADGTALATTSPRRQNCEIPHLQTIADQGPDRRISNAPSVTDSTISQTISIHSSSSEQAHRLGATVVAIHDVCLQATKTYLSSHHANRRVRASRSPEPFKTPTHHSQDNDNFILSGTPSSGQSQSPMPQQAHQSPIPHASDSLLKNVSGICNMLWVGSQRDRLVVLNVERMAVENMARLLGWAETVALGDYDEWTLAEDDALWRVLDAGRNLCAWLGVQESIRELEVLEGQLPVVRVYGAA